jgi:hypothetical protein
LLRAVVAGGQTGLDLLPRLVAAKGGPGSGTFGHEGRPGPVGGSAPSDSGGGSAPNGSSSDAVQDNGHDSSAKTVLRTAKDKPAKLLIKFDPKNQRAQDWARKHAAELAVNIAETTRQAIADAIVQAFEDGEEPEDAILDAVGDETRARLIARTEVLTATNEGQRAAWDAAVDAGLLTGNERRAWIATPGACDECEALDGTTTDLDGVYPDDGGDGPPLHPNCRCTEGITG